MNFKINLPGGMDLDATCFCGQAFRWEKSGDTFVGIVNGDIVNCKMDGDTLIVSAENENEEFWHNYFGAQLDYSALKTLFCTDKALEPCVKYAPGIRVLRQPFYETLCSFIISQNNNIPRIKGIISRLCEAYGKPLLNGNFAFPSAKDMAGLTVEDLAPLRSGFRAKYLLDAAKKVASGEVCEEKLLQLSNEDARKLLCTIFGVGPKVADCVLLYSLGRVDVIPMDVHMKRAMQERFPNGLTQDVAPYGGIAQQYIFHHTRTGK